MIAETAAPTSWWDSSGAVVLLTGLVSTITFWIGFVARPRTEARIRREAQREAEAAEWIKFGRDLTADLEYMLEETLSRHAIERDGSAPARAEWNEGFRRRVTLLSQFAHDPQIKAAAKQTRLRYVMVIRTAFAHENFPKTDPKYEEIVRRFERRWGEAHYALMGLIEMLGGEARRPREEVDYPLETDP